jgi:hypothetical protein
MTVRLIILMTFSIAARRTKSANAVQSLKFLKFVATPKSRLRTN